MSVLSAPAWRDSCDLCSDLMNSFKNRTHVNSLLASAGASLQTRALIISPQMPLNFLLQYVYLIISPQMPLNSLLQYVYLKFEPKRLLLKGFLLNDMRFFVFQEVSFLDDEVQYQIRCKSIKSILFNPFLCRPEAFR